MRNLEFIGNGTEGNILKNQTFLYVLLYKENLVHTFHVRKFDTQQENLAELLTNFGRIFLFFFKVLIWFLLEIKLFSINYITASGVCRCRNTCRIL